MCLEESSAAMAPESGSRSGRYQVLVHDDHNDEHHDGANGDGRNGSSDALRALEEGAAASASQPPLPPKRGGAAFARAGLKRWRALLQRAIAPSAAELLSDEEYERQLADCAWPGRPPA